MRSYKSGARQFSDELVEFIDDWLKWGTMTILLALHSKSPMRYSELKKVTELPSGTLDRRLSDLIKFELVRQKPEMTSSGRYRLVYELTDGAFEVLKGIEMFVAEDKLRKTYLDAINHISDLNETEKRRAKQEFLKSFESIRDAVARAFFKAIATARREG